MEHKPSILDLKVKHSKNGHIHYITLPSGAIYCTKSSSWLPSKPEDYDVHQERPVLPEDLIHLVVHGLVPPNDFEALKAKGMVDGSTQALWDKMETLRKFVAAKKQPPKTFEDLDWSGLNLGDKHG